MKCFPRTLYCLPVVLLSGVCFLCSASALTFTEWQATKFTTGELADPAISGANADPDGDGRQNLIEYAYGLDPLVADQDESAAATGPNGLTLTYPEVIGATDLLYHLEESPDLMHWITPNNTTRTVLADDGTMRLVSLFNPNAPAAPLRWFNRLQVILTPDGSEVLSAPTRLDAKLEIPFTIKIGWNDNTRTETGFAVERRVGANGPWEEIALTVADTNTFSDNAIVGSTDYTYRVSTVQGSYASDYSNEATLTTPLDTDQDGIPDDMEATYNTNPMAFSSGNNGTSDGWWVHYGLNPYSSSTQDTDGDGRSDADEFLDGTDPLTPDASPNPGAAAPAPPGDMTLTTLDSGANELTWTNHDTAKGIIVERNDGGTVWRTVAVLPGSDTTFTDETAQPGLVYFYRLVAYN